jgi:hypothetical protein
MLDPHGAFYMTLSQDLVDTVPDHFACNSTEVKRIADINISLDEERQSFHRTHQKKLCNIINTMPGALREGKRKKAPWNKSLTSRFQK